MGGNNEHANPAQGGHGRRRAVIDDLHAGREPEFSATPGLAVHPDCTPHQRGQLLAHCQAQPGAAVASCGGAVGLAEWLEQARLRLRLDADARVTDDESQDTGPVTAGVDVT